MECLALGLLRDLACLIGRCAGDMAARVGCRAADIGGLLLGDLTGGRAVMIYGQPMQFFRPSIGQRVAVFGTWVRDVEHGWNEMHPVWEVRYPDSGTLIYAIPPDPPLHVPNR